jgi:hypothetical protein
MSTPAPRPALQKSADAHIHPAAPGHHPPALRPASPAGGGATEPVPHRLSGPLHGNTSDSLRNATRKARRPPKSKSGDKQVPLEVRVPKSLRKEFRAAVKADKKDPDAVVAALLKAWLRS